MAKHLYCKSDEHKKCNGRIIMNGGNGMKIDSCKCECHKVKS